MIAKYDNKFFIVRIDYLKNMIPTIAHSNLYQEGCVSTEARENTLSVIPDQVPLSSQSHDG